MRTRDEYRDFALRGNGSAENCVMRRASTSRMRPDRSYSSSSQTGPSQESSGLEAALVFGGHGQLRVEGVALLGQSVVLASLSNDEGTAQGRAAADQDDRRCCDPYDDAQVHSLGRRGLVRLDEVDR